MTSFASLYELLAALLDYPTEETEGCAEQAVDALRSRLPEVAPLVEQWRRFFQTTPLWAVQELYTHTFDLNPVCSLDVGYYLFGEDYQRGMFLVRMRECLESVGLEGERELPDHLPVVLRWLARTQDEELHRDMVAGCLLPVLRKMDQALVPPPDAVESADGGVRRANPYRSLLQALPLVLERGLAELGARSEPAAVVMAPGGAP